MDLLLNVVFAWVTVGLMCALSVIYILRRFNMMYYKNKHEGLKSVNKSLRKPHKWLGIGAVVFGLLHGLYSTVKVVSVNLGTVLWIVLILLGISFFLRKKLIKNYPWIKVHRFLVVVSICLLVIHVIDVGGFVGVDPIVSSVRNDLSLQQPTAEVEVQEDSTADEMTVEEETTTEILPEEVVAEEIMVEEQVEEAPPEPSYIYNDGTYTGVADGFGPNLTVEIVIEKDIIVSVEVVSHNEKKERYWGKPVREIPVAIVDDQSTDVDIISGATYTSYGIMNAVDDALSKALK